MIVKNSAFILQSSRMSWQRGQVQVISVEIQYVRIAALIRTNTRSHISNNERDNNKKTRCGAGKQYFTMHLLHQTVIKCIISLITTLSVAVRGEGWVLATPQQRFWHLVVA